MGLSITKIEDVKIYIQMQDSRNLGTMSGSIINDMNLGIHQAYIKMSKLTCEFMWLQVGRFEVSYGRERLIGTVGWSNIGRTFDGVRLHRDIGSSWVDIFSLKINDRGFIGNHKDQNLYGIYSGLMDNQVDLFFLYDWDQLEAGEGSDDSMLKRFTIGTYIDYASDDSGISFDLDAAFQGGNAAGTDISAFMVAGEFGYEFSEKFSNLGVGADITSGDDDPGDDKYKWFDNLYYTGHKFRGNMDFFTSTSALGLMDLFVNADYNAKEDLVFGAAFHMFSTMQDYNTMDGTSKSLGNEIDLTGKYFWQNGLTFEGGASIFMASEDWRGPDADPAYWFYLMITAGF
jgi:hypothetical protein